MRRFYFVLVAVLLSACTSIPESVKPVSNFELERYMGKWYEIARLDHSFERGMEQVTATYSLNDDGTVRVVNKGFVTKKEKWKDAVGKAKFAGDSDIGHLKVSFFGPFYGSYVIFELDEENYQYSFITGSENTLWLLSRTPTINDGVRGKFLTMVKERGYDIEELIFVRQQ